MDELDRSPQGLPSQETPAKTSSASMEARQVAAKRRATEEKDRAEQASRRAAAAAKRSVAASQRAEMSRQLAARVKEWLSHARGAYEAGGGEKGPVEDLERLHQIGDDRDRVADRREREADDRDRVADRRESGTDGEEAARAAARLVPHRDIWWARRAARIARSRERFAEEQARIRAQSAWLAEQMADQADTFAAWLEANAVRADAERRLALATTERSAARELRRRATQWRSPPPEEPPHEVPGDAATSPVES